jgi:hypothetical protein
MRKCLIVLVLCVSVLVPALTAWSHQMDNPASRVVGDGACSECCCSKYMGQVKAGAFCQRESCMHACELHSNPSAAPEGK